MGAATTKEKAAALITGKRDKGTIHPAFVTSVKGMPTTDAFFNPKFYDANNQQQGDPTTLPWLNSDRWEIEPYQVGHGANSTKEPVRFDRSASDVFPLYLDGVPDKLIVHHHTFFFRVKDKTIKPASAQTMEKNMRGVRCEIFVGGELKSRGLLDSIGLTDDGFTDKFLGFSLWFGKAMDDTMHSYVVEERTAFPLRFNARYVEVMKNKKMGANAPGATPPKPLCWQVADDEHQAQLQKLLLCQNPVFHNFYEFAVCENLRGACHERHIKGDHNWPWISGWKVSTTDPSSVNVTPSTDFSYSLNVIRHVLTSAKAYILEFTITAERQKPIRCVSVAILADTTKEEKSSSASLMKNGTILAFSIENASTGKYWTTGEAKRLVDVLNTKFRGEYVAHEKALAEKKREEAAHKAMMRGGGGGGGGGYSSSTSNSGSSYNNDAADRLMERQHEAQRNLDAYTRAGGHANPNNPYSGTF